METLARKLANRIALSLEYDAEKEAVVAYGLIAIIQATLTTLMVLFIGLLFRVPAEAMIICLSVSILRKYSGGAHAETAEFCTCFSVFYCVVMAVISKKAVAIYHPITMAAVSVVIYGLSFLAVYRLAPVDSPKKPIRTEKKRKRMKNSSYIVLLFYLLLSAAFYFLGYRAERFKSYGVSMIFGVSWQIFTLTSYGALFIGKMNHLFAFGKEE